MEIKLIIYYLAKLATNAVTVRQAQRFFGRKYGTLIFKRNNIEILHKCAIDRLIYLLCFYIKNILEVPKVLLPPLIFINNNWYRTNRDEFNEPIQYINDSPNYNP